jgi:hypothetical protein
MGKLIELLASAAGVERAFLVPLGYARLGHRRALPLAEEAIAPGDAFDAVFHHALPSGIAALGALRLFHPWDSFFTR